MKDDVIKPVIVIGLCALLIAHQEPHIEHSSSAVYTPAMLWLDATGIERPAFRAPDPGAYKSTGLTL